MLVRVLVADDEDAMIRVLERCLRTWGYEPVIARSGDEAWRVLKRDDAPRVVILDWDMPGLTGLKVCQLFRSTPHGAGAYVLLLTGRLAKADLVEALESGADDFISKPFDARELRLRLAKGLEEAARTAKSLERSPAGAPPSGSTLGGKYRLERKIGEGGMGSVWLGTHLALHIDVAIKFMSPKLAETAAYASFEREARAAALLKSEHIVRVYDHGIAHDGSPYLVMEYLEGESLGDRVERRGPLEPLVVCAIVEQVARALAEAHGHGVVHRDVKPDNILLIDDPERAHGVLAKLIDFGLAQARQDLAPPLRSAPSAPRLPSGDASAAETRHFDVSGGEKGGLARAGTPIYMSPEALAEGGPPTPRLDLWGLAATTFFAMTGQLPFYGDSLVEVFRCVCEDPLPVPSQLHRSVPSGFDAWFARACARPPTARFPSAHELAIALATACREPVVAVAPAISTGPRSVAPTEPESKQ